MLGKKKKGEIVDDGVRDYEAVSPIDIDSMHSMIDGLKNPVSNDEVDDNQIDKNNGNDNPGDMVDELPSYDTSENIDVVDNDGGVNIPESYEVAAHKYNIEADIAPGQMHDFDPNRAFFGRHVVNSNTKRMDNFRHLMQMDLCDDYDLIPTRRQRSNIIRQRVTAEYQSCRSNPEIGGFDRKLQRSVIKKEDVDLRQTQNLNRNNAKRKTLFGRIIGGK